jgi:hypothetical protein
MAITIPASPIIVTPDQVQFRKLDEDPMHSLLQDCNWLYANHSPALVNLAFTGDATASHDYVFPMPASADGLTYKMFVNWYASASANITTKLYEAAASSNPGGGWGTQIMADTTASGGAGNQWVSATGTIASTTNFGKLEVVPSTGNVQVHSVIIFPDTIASISAGAKSSGFVPYDSAALNDQYGAIHVEYGNRIATNVRSVLRDRRQAIFGHCDDVTSAKIAYASKNTGSSQVIGFAGAHLAGQKGATVTVRARANKASGAGTATLHVAELGGEYVDLAVDDADNTGTLVLRSDQPLFQAQVDYSGTATMDLRYVTIDWRPGD